MSKNRSYIFSKSLYQSSAPFSHIVIANGVGYVSGIIGQRRDNGAVVDPDTATQARAMFDNLEVAVSEAGFSLADIITTRLYLLDYAEFDVINGVYRERLSEPFPARTTLQVSGLPLNARVQIDATIDATTKS